MKTRAAAFTNYLKQFLGEKLEEMHQRPFDASYTKGKDETEKTQAYLRYREKDIKKLNALLKGLSTPIITANLEQRKKQLQMILKLYDEIAKDCINAINKTIKSQNSKGITEKAKKQSIEAMQNYIFNLVFSQLDEKGTPKIGFLNDMTILYRDLKSKNIPVDSDQVLVEFDRHVPGRISKGTAILFDLYTNSNVVEPAYYRDINPDAQSAIFAQYVADLSVNLTSVEKRYKDAGRKTHQSEFTDIRKAIDGINNDTVKRNARAKYVMMINKLEDAFLKAERDTLKPFLESRANRSIDSSMDKYIEKINNSKSGYHYPKLLAKMLYDAYEKDPALKNTQKGAAIYRAVCKIEGHRLDMRNDEKLLNKAPPKAKKRLGI